MATKDESEEKPKSSPKKKGKLLKIMLALAVLAGGGGGAWWYVNERPAADAEADAPKEKPAVFFTLDSFTVNLQHETEGEDQYLQVGLTLKATEPATLDILKLHTPEIRNKILLLLSDKKASELSTSAGKQQLSTEILNTVRESIPSKQAQEDVIDALFTSFVIQ